MKVSDPSDAQKVTGENNQQKAKSQEEERGFPRLLEALSQNSSLLHCSLDGTSQTKGVLLSTVITLQNTALIISRDLEKRFDKTQHQFTIKTHSKLGTERNLFSCIKNIYEKPTAIIIIGQKQDRMSALAISSSFFFFFSGCGPFLKSLLNLLQYCFCFMFCFFGLEACGILVPRSGIELHPLHWKAKS